jgi:hypothetical protein
MVNNGRRMGEELEENGTGGEQENERRMVGK